MRIANTWAIDHFRHRRAARSSVRHRFVVAPNFIATEINRAESTFCTAVGSLRFDGCALFAPHVPISSLLHNVGKHTKLAGGERRIRTVETLRFSARLAARPRPLISCSPIGMESARTTGLLVALRPMRQSPDWPVHFLGIYHPPTTMVLERAAFDADDAEAFAGSEYDLLFVGGRSALPERSTRATQ
jgi:hypothetical protein